ncbi:MAG TPA: histidine phosphatase family protein [Candidatus Limnocylindrales bacterium]|nr:histidine phosphatase family protein [Candidatus Limnocylindrales bacterium]
MALQLVYETHAITTDNEAGIATGWLPGELSARGRETAAELGARRRDDGLDAVYVSDLERALETVRIAFADVAIPTHIDGRLRECNYGRRNGMPRQDLERERAHHLDFPWLGGESYRDVVARTRSLLDDLRARHDGGRVLVVAHSANLLALDHLLLGYDLGALIAAPFEWQPGWEYVLETVPPP